MDIKPITVEYIDHLGSDLTVVNAARTSFGKESEWEPGSSLRAEGPRLKQADADLIRFLATGYRTSEWDELLDEVLGVANKHTTSIAKIRLTKILHAYKRKAQHFAPFAHPHMQIRMTLPIFLARQFVKHQIGGVWSEESRRYISDEPGVWFPSEWHTRPDDIKQGSGGALDRNGQVDVDQVTREAVTNSLEAYSFALAMGATPEEARIVLPLNTMTTVTWTGSLLFWSRVCNQRVDSHAQLAAQELGKKIASLAQPLFPVSWAALVGE